MMVSPPDPVPTVLTAPPRRIGRPVLAWAAIAILVGAILILHALRGSPAGNTSADRAQTWFIRMQGQYLVGMADLFQTTTGTVYAEAVRLNTGPVPQRWAFIVLAGELAGPQEALKQLRRLDEELARQGVAVTPRNQSIHDLFVRLYRDYDNGEWQAPSLSDADHDLLRRDLGWFGQLALAPAKTPDRAARERVLRPAQRTVVTMLVLAAVIGVLALGGLAGLFVMAVLLASGKLRAGLQTGSPYGAVYAETFAIWLALMLAINGGMIWWPWAESRFLALGIGDLLTLAALAWPVLRGVPWRQVRYDIGLTRGRQPGLEPMIGGACYAMTMPLLMVGMLLVLVLLRLQRGLEGFGDPEDYFSPTRTPTHPIVEYLARGDWRQRLQLLLVASVAAPIVEETMFRGVLYRHLREASRWMRSATSVLLSALIVSLLFAAIHPQGLVAIPALMALAFGFNLAREWRGTLVPSMIAHAINNGLLVMVFLLIFGD
jgi:membrane protease YdiL (CAAX protease family)